MTRKVKINEKMYIYDSERFKKVLSEKCKDFQGVTRMEEELAKKVNVSPETIRAWKKGNSCPTDISQIISIIEYLSVPLSEVFEEPVAPEKRVQEIASETMKIKKRIYNLPFNEEFVICYMSNLKGYYFSRLEWKRLLKGKLCPSENFIKDLLQLLETAEQVRDMRMFPVECFDKEESKNV